MNEIIVHLEGKEYQIDIQKAKEIGVLKEKDSRCKSWEEFKLKYKNSKSYYTDSQTGMVCDSLYPIGTCEQLTQQEAIAIQAFSKLLKLRRDWIGDWNPDWKNAERKYCIVAVCNILTITSYYSDHHTFSFPTEEMAREFFYCFIDLFEQCKCLI